MPIGGYLRASSAGVRKRNVIGAAGRWLGWRGVFARASCRAAGSGLSTRPLARPAGGTALRGFNLVLWGFNSVSRSPGGCVCGPGEETTSAPRNRGPAPGRAHRFVPSPEQENAGQRRRRHDRAPGHRESGPRSRIPVASPRTGGAKWISVVRWCRPGHICGSVRSRLALSVRKGGFSGFAARAAGSA
jgi:hypothetical protein